MVDANTDPIYAADPGVAEEEASKDQEDSLKHIAKEEKDAEKDMTGQETSHHLTHLDMNQLHST